MRDLSGTVYFKRSGLLEKQIEGEIVIYDDLEAEVIRFNESASRIWQLICARKSVEDIVKSLVSDFRGEEKAIRKDVSAFIRQLLSLELIEVIDYEQKFIGKEV